jgi:5-methyltetrahydropteroyltriglutamate--homocysteine methyltransferase
MASAHHSAHAHFNAQHDLKSSIHAWLAGELSEDALRAAAGELRANRWQRQQAAGIEQLPVGDFAWQDSVLTHSLMLGVIPQRFAGSKDSRGLPTLATLFAMAGDAGSDADDQAGRWFDTESRYVAPQFTREQRFQLSWEQLFEEVEEAKGLGHAVKPVLIGPLTYLWLGDTTGEPFDKLDLLERLLPLYGEILGRLAGQGVEWVQIDEPILALELPQDWKSAFERAYHILQYSPLKKLLVTYAGALTDNLGLAACLPVQGLHVDLVQAPEQLAAVLDRVPTYKVLSLGVIDERSALFNSPPPRPEQVEEARLRFGDNLWLAGSRALLHCPSWDRL